MNGFNSPARKSEPDAEIPVAKRLRSAARVAVAGHINGKDVIFSADLQKFIADQITTLAQRENLMDQSGVLQAMEIMMNMNGYLSSDLTLAVIAAVLSQLGVPCTEIAQIAATNKKTEKSVGSFRSILKSKIQLIAPSLYELYLRYRNASYTTEQLATTNTPKPTGAQATINEKVEKVLATPIVDDPENTGHADMEGSFEVRPTNTVDDIIAILSRAPQNQETELVQIFLMRTVGIECNVAENVSNIDPTNILEVNDAWKLLSALNDESVINISECERNPVWHFLWGVRAKLWKREDLQPYIDAYKMLGLSGQE